MYIYVYIYIYSPDLAALQTERFVACHTVISNTSIDTLHNGWSRICCVTVSKQEITQKNKEPKHRHTNSPTHLYKSNINPQKDRAAALPPPTPFGDGYGICPVKL